MTFPIEPERGDSSAQFLIQDPFDLRKQILPVLTVDKSNGFLTGLGTTFRVDPFGTFVTAEHVLKDHFETPGMREIAVATVLYGMGLVYGTVGLSSKYFAPIREAVMWRKENLEPDPPIGLKRLPRIVADIMRFHVDDSDVPGQPASPPLPVRLSGRQPKVGDRVMAIGYPELTCIQHDPPENAMTFTERMYGAVGTVPRCCRKGVGQAILGR